MNRMISFYSLTFENFAGFAAAECKCSRDIAAKLYRHIYRTGNTANSDMEKLTGNTGIVDLVKMKIDFSLPEAEAFFEDQQSLKFSLRFDDGNIIESVILKMKRFDTLCVSSQAGCARGCRFCHTARMGFSRNLTADEIVKQAAAARNMFGRNIRNIVFMGMGEPFDNFDEIMKSVEIISCQQGLDIAKTAVTISTCGNAGGIDKFAGKIRTDTAGGWHRVHLAVSINSADNKIRNSLMPVNREFPLEVLKDSLEKFPLKRKRDRIFCEYVMLAGINDSREDAFLLAKWLKGLPAAVNLIRYNPGPGIDYSASGTEVIEEFFKILRASGIECRYRESRGQSAYAGCGQLGISAAGQEKLI